MDEILLSICIPTYNRASVLDLCIKSIVSQTGFDNRTEIVILDNASTDNTTEIVTIYSKYYSNIKYYRNDENIGMEKNILKVLEYGNGKLLKLLNDYSLLEENMLLEIINIIKSNYDEKSILYFQNQNLKTRSQHCTDLNSFLRATTYWVTWIGSFSIWKSDYLKIYKTNNFEGLLFPHLLMLLHNFDKKNNIKIIHIKVFGAVGSVQKGGYDFIEIFIQNFINKIIHKLYDTGAINLKTLYIVKSSFLRKFLIPMLVRIKYESNYLFQILHFSLILRYFKLYPFLYLGIVHLYLYPVIKILTPIRTKIKVVANKYNIPIRLNKY